MELQFSMIQREDKLFTFTNNLANVLKYLVYLTNASGRQIKGNGCTDFGVEWSHPVLLINGPGSFDVKRVLPPLGENHRILIAHSICTFPSGAANKINNQLKS